MEKNIVLRSRNMDDNELKAYNILKIQPTSNLEEIKTAYKKLAMKYHPDKNPNNIEFSNNKMKEINWAYQTLTKQSTEPLAIFPEELFRDTFFDRRSPFGSRNPFVNFDFINFNSKVTGSSVILEIDESNSKDIDLIPEILGKAGFTIKSFTITKYH